MLIAFTIMAVVTGGIAVVANSLKKAPMGYEDELGFHILPQTKGSAILPRQKSGVTTDVSSLKGARVNSCAS